MENLILNDLTKPGKFTPNLVLNDRVIVTRTESVEGRIFWRFEDEPTATPQLLGIAAAGKSLALPFDMSQGRPIRLFLVSRTAAGNFSVADVREAVQAVFDPNIETLTPVIFPLTAATNTEVTIGVNNFTTLARFRQIVVSPNSDMSSPDSTVTQEASEFGQNLLPPTVLVTKTGEPGTVTKYIQVAHSSNGSDYGTPSNILTVVFANSGGSGGSGGDPDGACFVGETLINVGESSSIDFALMYENRQRDWIGNSIKSFDKNGEIVEAVIEDVFKHTVFEYLEVMFEDDDAPIGVTAEHPFFTESKEFIAIGKLQVGDKVLEHWGSYWHAVTILSIKKITCPDGVDVYNMRTSTGHYFIEEKGVHNSKDVNL